MKSEFKARPVYLQKDNRIKAHFLTCFLALMFIRIIESKTDNKISVETLIDILKDYNFQHFEGNGYVPTYTRNEMTDLFSYFRLVFFSIFFNSFFETLFLFNWY